MKTPKRLGICLDHSEASIIEYNTDNPKVRVIKSDMKGLDNQESNQHSESLLHHKENQNIKNYYKNLITIINDYDEILLFGPTNAKNELFNLIREEHKYDHLKIVIKSAKKMTLPEEHAYVINHFKTVLNYESSFKK